MTEIRYPKVGVGMFVMDHRGFVLLGKRLGKYGTGFLSLPGGKVDMYERLEVAAVRETMEEVNLEVKSPKIIGVMDEIFPEYDEHYATIYFLGHTLYPKNYINMEPHKHESWDWYDILNGPPDGLWAPLVEFLTDPEKPRLLLTEIATHRYWNAPLR